MVDEEVDSIWDRFDNHRVAFDDFGGVDDDLVVSADMNGTDIVAAVLEKHTEAPVEESEPSDEEDISDHPLPTASEALSGLDAVRCYIEAHSDGDNSTFS